VAATLLHLAPGFGNAFANLHNARKRRVLPGELEPVREHMGRLFEAPLKGDATNLPVAAHRAAFLAYLRFCKASLSGQTGLQPWPAWASQAALVQGMAEVGLPDLILREERLAEGLGFLCAELGLPCPPVGDTVQATGPVPLSAFADDEVIAAAKAAYARDYEQFGFGDLPG